MIEDMETLNGRKIRTKKEEEKGRSQREEGIKRERLEELCRGLRGRESERNEVRKGESQKGMMTENEKLIQKGMITEKERGSQKAIKSERV